jgi:homoserine O-acetyltransferase
LEATVKNLSSALALAVALASAGNARAQGYPSPKEGDWIARDFRFHTGEVLPELRIHYTTVGLHSGEPVRHFSAGKLVSFLCEARFAATREPAASRTSPSTS